MKSQSFCYESRLAADQVYLMTVDMEQQENPPRLVLRVRLATPRDEARLVIETILRIIPAAEGAAS